MKLMMIAGALTLGLAMPVIAQAPAGEMSKANFMAQSKAQFDAIDADHDGVVSREELTAMITKQAGGPPPAAVIDGFLGVMDANHDGKISADEWATVQGSMFDRIDANHDGTLTPDEMSTAQQRLQAPPQQKPQ